MTRTAILVCLFLCANGVAHAAFIPAGLQPGDTYYLAFVTQDRMDATSPDISVYNAFVQSQAALNPSLTGTDQGVQYRAIGSTPTVDARDNVVLNSSSPIYLLNGAHLANGDRLWIGPLVAFNITQFLDYSDGEVVWTGSNILARKHAISPLGSSGGGSMFGNSSTVSSEWISYLGTSSTDPALFYGVSNLITVPVPEPSSIVLLGTAALFAAAVRLRAARRSR